MCNTPGLGGSKQAGTSESFGPLGGGAVRSTTQNTLADLLTGAGFTGVEGNNYGGGIFNQLRGRLNTVPILNAYQLPTLDSSGLQSEQANALQQPFQQAVSQALGRFSSIGAQRGFLRPENVQAIAGAAAQNVAPQFAQLMSGLSTQNLQQRTQAPLMQNQILQQQEDLTRQRFSDLMNAMGLGATLLGGQAFQQSSGVQNSNFLGSILNTSISAVGQAKSGSTTTTNNY